ncbi:MAG: oligosaccharide deacetylase [Bacteroidia bacterium]|nr:MAG: oligosaccharide deacetylase [Bacteroidia bacterium]
MTIPTTRPLQKLFPQIRWNGPDKSLYLTFDDGPHSEATPRVLDVLSAHRIKATFFLIGVHVKRHPEIVRRIAAEGHTIGNHSFDHPLMIFRDAAFLRSQILLTREIIEDSAGIPCRYFRPPYGAIGPAVYRIARENDQETVLWDIDSGDFRSSDPERAARRSAQLARSGSILLFHDNEQTKSRIGDILQRFLDLLPSDRRSFAVLPP